MSGDDWLSKLASTAGAVGSYFGLELGSEADRKMLSEIPGAVAGGFQWATDKDFTKASLGPVLAGLHMAGIGKEGDEWDKGYLGLLGTGFQKIGRLGTYAALGGGHDDLGRKAWNAAFEADPSKTVDFGAALEATYSGRRNSLLQDPNGIADFHKWQNSTWWGNYTAGATTIAYTFITDPTRGVGKASKLANAGKYIADGAQADRVALAMNEAVGSGALTASVGVGKAAAAATKTGAALKSVLVRPLSDAEQSGTLMAGMGRFHNVTDVNTIENMVAPMVGEGSTSARLAVPLASELLADAGYIADATLQAQTKAHIFLALAQGEESMKWLVDSAPLIAAKARRATGVPAEFNMLHNALDDIATRGGIENFDLGTHLDAHFDSPANLAELAAVKSKVADIRKFRETLAHGDNGEAINFGTSGKGTLVAPRTLEYLKAGINNRITGSYLLQDGASGRTMRIVDAALSKAVTPQSRTVTSVEDPIMGNKQLLNTLREFNTKMRGPDGVEAFTADQMRAASETFLKGTVKERHDFLEGLNDTLIEKVAAKFNDMRMSRDQLPMTADSIRELTRTSHNVRASHTAYVLRRTSNAKFKGEVDTYLGDIAGGDTVWDTAALSSQMEGTHFLFDWKTANRAVDAHYTANRMLSKSTIGKGEQWANSDAAHGLNVTMRLWKHNVLMRPGLATRALLDTSARSAAATNIGLMALQSLAGLNNVFRNSRAGGLLGVGPSATLVMSDADKVGAEMATATIGRLRAEGAAEGAAHDLRTVQAQKAWDLSKSFAAKKHNDKGDYYGLTSQYRQREWAAKDLALRLEDEQRIFGSGKSMAGGTTPLDASGRPILAPVRDDLLKAEEEVALAKSIEAGLTAEQKLNSGRKMTEENATAATAAAQAGKDAKARMIEANKGLVASIAKSYTGRGVNITDLVANGNIGLTRAVEKFDYTKGNKFSTYATRWVRQAITKDMADKSRNILPRADLEGSALHTRFAESNAARDTAIAGQEQALATYNLGSETGGKFSILTTPHTAFGREWKSVKDQMEASRLPAGLKGDGQVSDLYITPMSKTLPGYKVEAGASSGNVAVTDALYNEKYAMMANEGKRSYTFRRVAIEGDSFVKNGHTHDMVVDSFMNDPLVEAEFKSLSGGKVSRADAEHWFSTVVNSVMAVAPTAATRKLIAGSGEVTADMVKGTIHGADRFPIYAPEIYRDPARAAAQLTDKVYNVMLNLPDYHLARVPMYNGLYHSNVQFLGQKAMARVRAEGRTELTDAEAKTIHSGARQMAINDVRRDMYDVTRNVGTHGAMSLISPFFAPWEDAMMSWGRLIYEDPARLGQLMRWSNAPDMFHISTNAQGEKVSAFDGTALSDRYVQVPLFGLGGLEGHRWNLGSFNSIQQGSVPFSPGVGPLVQVPATFLVARVLPNLGEPGQAAFKFINEHPDSIISKTVFAQGGIPKAGNADLATSLLSAYQRKIIDVMVGDSGGSFGSVYTTAYGTRLNDLLVQYNTAHGGAWPTSNESKALQAEASHGAVAAGVVAAAIQFGLGVSGTAAPEGQLYLDKYHALNAARDQLATVGLTPEGVFATKYPAASQLNWTFSKNEGRLEASVNSTSAFYKYKALMDAPDGKDIAWWIAGADNIMANATDATATAGNTFSQAAYNQQMTAGLRRRYNKDDLNAQADISMGYAKMAAYDSALALFMRQNGVVSLQSKNAGQLAMAKAQFKKQLGDQFPSWANEVHTYNIKGRDDQINHIDKLLRDNTLAPSLRDRPDVLTTRKYMFARNTLVRYAQEQGVQSWQTSKQFSADRFALWQFGQSLAAKDVVFQQGWSRLFETEFKNDLTPNVGS